MTLSYGLSYVLKIIAAIVALFLALIFWLAWLAPNIQVHRVCSIVEKFAPGTASNGLIDLIEDPIFFGLVGPVKTIYDSLDYSAPEGEARRLFYQEGRVTLIVSGIVLPLAACSLVIERGKIYSSDCYQAKCESGNCPLPTIATSERRHYDCEK